MTITARKLGRLPAVHNLRTPRLADVLSQHLPEPPPTKDWGARFTSWPLWRNGDQLSNHGATIPGLGDCTAVGVASAIRVLTANRGGEELLTDDQVVGIYERNGYDPTNPATDQGAVEAGGSGVLDHWCATGYDIGRQAPDVLTGYGVVNARDRDSVRRAIAMLGGLYIGLSLPDYALSTRGGWVYQAGATIAGGHCVFVSGYDSDWLYANTWGERQPMDWDFFAAFADEAYGLISRDWLDTHGTSPMREDFAGVCAECRAAV